MDNKTKVNITLDILLQYVEDLSILESLVEHLRQVHPDLDTLITQILVIAKETINETPREQRLEKIVNSLLLEQNKNLN